MAPANGPRARLRHFDVSGRDQARHQVPGERTLSATAAWRRRIGTATAAATEHSGHARIHSPDHLDQACDGGAYAPEESQPNNDRPRMAERGTRHRFPLEVSPLKAPGVTALREGILLDGEGLDVEGSE